MWKTTKITSSSTRYFIFYPFGSFGGALFPSVRLLAISTRLWPFLTRLSNLMMRLRWLFYTGSVYALSEMGVVYLGPLINFRMFFILPINLQPVLLIGAGIAAGLTIISLLEEYGAYLLILAL